MKTVRVTAHAKINLTLDVVGEEGGYHALDSLVATIALGDRIVARARTDGRVFVTMHGMGSERIPAGRNNAALAAERFFAAFGGGGELPEVEVSVETPAIIPVLVAAKLCSSNGEARRLIQQGGVSIGENKVTDINAPVKSGDIIHKGKKQHIKVILK